MKLNALFCFASATLIAGLLTLAALPAHAQSAADAGKLDPASGHSGQIEMGPGYAPTTPPSIAQLRGDPDIVIVDNVDFPVANSTDGSSINWVTGDTCDCDTNPGFHFNPWSSGGNLAFWWWNGTDERAGLSNDGTTYAVLGEGDTIGPASTFISAGFPAGTVNWRQAGNVDGYLGFRFDNAGTINYGYARLTTTGTTGHPATIVSYAYNQVGDPITIAGDGPQDPEIEVSPESFAITVDAGTSDTETLEITNIGGQSLDWSIELEPGLAGLRDHDPLLDEALGFPEFTVISPANGGEPVVFDVTAGVLTNGIVVGFSFEGTVAGVSGNSDWASDMCMQIEGPDGSSYSVGGIGAVIENCNINDWDFQGGGSTADGTYSSEHDNVWPFPPGAADEGDWTFTFIHGWNSASANPMTWSDVTVTLHKIVEPEPCDSPGAVSWLSVDPTSGSAESGSPSMVDVIVDSDGLAVGTYNANLCITSNDTAGNELVVVPLELTVEPGDAPEIEVIPASLFGSTSSCDATNLALDIINTGTAELTWTIEEAPAVSPRAHFPAQPYQVASRAGEAFLGAEPLDAEWLAKMAADARAAEGWQLIERGTGDPIPAYSTSGFSRADYVSMDALAPETLTSIVDPGPATVFAQTFIDDDFSQQFFIATGGNVLVQGAYGFVDTETGAVDQLGILSGVPETGTWSSAAWDPTSGTVYAVIVPGGGNNQLFEIDLDTGVGTLVGTVSGIVSNGIIIGIAIDSSGLMYAVEIIDDVLVAIDKTDAVGAVIGPLGVDANFAQDLDFDRSTDTLYWASYLGGGNSNIRIIDTSTGATTLVGPIQDGAELLSFSIAVAGGSNCESPGDVPWMSLDTTAGSIQPGDGADTVQVTLDPDGLFSGTYQALLCINSNDPMTPLVEVPVAFEVQTTCVEDDIFADRFED